MDYYGTLRNEYIHKEMYPTDHRTDYIPKGPFTGSSVKITPKPNCVPRFVMKIEGNAVEEGERVFFEGIVDAQPQPIFSWYFNDEPVEPGRPGWEDAEVHESRKMSTLILTYAREHHMGKYTLVAQNKMGHSTCTCDLIVRKKQFPPVFWQRLYSYEATAGSKLIAEVEVGGWPIPDLVWYKDDEPVQTVLHTENYNGFPNKYVPDRRIEVRQIDPIRHCIIFHRISESDAGMYTVVARNPLGEAVCQAQFIIEPGEGGGADLYLPEKWRTGKRLTWADEDRRVKKFVGFKEPELTDEDIAEMTSRISSVPLPRALEYLASLPDYYPTPIPGLEKMTFKPENEADIAGRREGKKGGKPSRPSKFVPGKINHTGYRSDDPEPITPMWFNELDPNSRDPNLMAYQPVRYTYPPLRPRPEREKSPPCPHEWEAHETIDDLYKLLDTVGCRILLADIRKDIVLNASAAERQNTQQQKSYLKKTAEARKQIIHYENKKQDESIKAKQVQKFSYLNPNKSAPGQSDEPDSSRRVTAHREVEAFELVASQQQQHHQQHQHQQMIMEEHPPALPPKTKIMNSPSRHLFSPTESFENASSEIVQTADYMSVKEKAKIIALQQEEIFRREERYRQTGNSGDSMSGPTGGVRILPPSPVTVRRPAFAEEDPRGSPAMTRRTTVDHHHAEAASSSMKVVKFAEARRFDGEEDEDDVDDDELNEYERLAAEAEREEQQRKYFSSTSSQVQSSHSRQEEVMYVTEVSSKQSQVMTMAMSSSAAAAQQVSTLTSDKGKTVMIPRLEDKYGVESHLEELSSTIDSEESFTSTQTAAQSTTSQSTSTGRSMMTASSVQSGYSSMSAASSSTTTMQQRASQSVTSESSSKTIMDSSYSTASQVSSVKQQQQQEFQQLQQQQLELQQKQQLALKQQQEQFELEQKQQLELMQQQQQQFELKQKEQLQLMQQRQQQQQQQQQQLQSEVVSQRVAQIRGRETEKTSNREETSWSVRDARNASPMISESPRVARRPRVDQSPRRQDNESPKYRTPPSTPFQPGFYKKPSEEEMKINPFPMPSPNLRRPRRQERRQDEGSDSEDDNV